MNRSNSMAASVLLVFVLGYIPAIYFAAQLGQSFGNTVLALVLFIGTASLLSRVTDKLKKHTSVRAIVVGAGLCSRFFACLLVVWYFEYPATTQEILAVSVLLQAWAMLIGRGLLSLFVSNGMVQVRRP